MNNYKENNGVITHTCIKSGGEYSSGKTDDRSQWYSTRIQAKNNKKDYLSKSLVYYEYLI